ncbi:MAG: DUF1559 domain-containing protein [Pirellulaceae bacterium]
MSQTERRQMTIQNMTRIGQAMEAYLAAENRYPSFAIHGPTGQPLLSWRVALLPYLGYAQLYQQFHLDEPWNSPHNSQLLKMIPAVYQSPERLDSKTNYLVPVSTSGPFYGKTGKVPRRWEDGLQNVAIVIEVDDVNAVEWSRPFDYEVDLTKPKLHLGNQRADGLLVIWGGGQLARLAPSTPASAFKAMFTVDGGEVFSAAAISLAATAELDKSLVAKSTTATRPKPTGSPEAINNTKTAIATHEKPTAVRASSAAGPNLTFALRAFENGDLHSANKFLQLASLTNEIAPQDMVRWIPAIHRPAMSINFGLSLEYTGPNTRQADTLAKQVHSAPSANNAASKGLTTLAGELAKRVCQQLDQVPVIAPDYFQTPSNRRSVQSVLQQLKFLGVGSESVIYQAAQMESVDAVLHFVVEDRRSRSSGVVHKSCRIKVLDVWRRKEIFRSDELNYTKRQRRLTDPLFVDPLDQISRDVRELFEQEFTFAPVPAELRSVHAKKRLASLANQSVEDPVGVLAEANYYYSRELVGMSDVVALYQHHLGEEAGLRLLAGSSGEKIEVLKKWTPAEPLEVRVASSDAEDERP